MTGVFLDLIHGHSESKEAFTDTKKTNGHDKDEAYQSDSNGTSAIKGKQRSNMRYLLNYNSCELCNFVTERNVVQGVLAFDFKIRNSRNFLIFYKLQSQFHAHIQGFPLCTNSLSKIPGIERFQIHSTKL